MSNLQTAKDIFKKYSGKDEIHFTSDGQPFFEANPAANHGKTLTDKSIEIISRSQVKEDKAEGAAPKAEKPAAPKVEKPAAPKVEKPAAPKAEKPAAPKAEKPAAPKVEKPAAPKVEKPVAPKAEKPAKAEEPPVV